MKAKIIAEITKIQEEEYNSQDRPYQRLERLKEFIQSLEEPTTKRRSNATK